MPMIMHKSSADICDYYYHYHHHDYYYYIQYNDCNESEKLSSIDALSSDIAYFTLSERLMLKNLPNVTAKDSNLHTNRYAFAKFYYVVHCDGCFKEIGQFQNETEQANGNKKILINEFNR
ncbi:hypothetical protein T02_9432 [Trichinella nativa]|uniref:Uncharacterized protein n=1 Tax=Trichinella nativa TaxID=6335 RepID=A0A0V1KVH8_9BILA|nr:hypothetical protein T02_9432 [Trichinella nativa]